MTQQHEVKLACTFCGKSQREVRKLIAGPTVYICDECIKLCNDILAEKKDRRLEAESQAQEEKKERAKESVTLCCSFCGKKQREVKSLIAGPCTYICDECIGLCNDIIWEEIDRENSGDTLRAMLPEDVRTLMAAILERGIPAALQIRDVLRERIIEDIDRRRAAGEGPDELLWVPDGLAADWRELHDILARATLRESEAARRGPFEEALQRWVLSISERLEGSLEVLCVLARSLEKPGLEEVRQLHPSVAFAREKLREAREMLLAGPSGSYEEPS